MCFDIFNATESAGGRSANIVWPRSVEHPDCRDESQSGLQRWRCNNPTQGYSNRYSAECFKRLVDRSTRWYASLVFWRVARVEVLISTRRGASEPARS
jgi:hypothetical protein